MAQASSTVSSLAEAGDQGKKVAINGYFLTEPMSGSGQYLLHLLRELADIWEGQLMVFCPSAALARASFISQLFPPTEKGVHNVKIIPVPMPKGNLGKVWFEQVAIPWLCVRNKANLLHVPYLSPPFFSPCPTVVTVHDLIGMALPGLPRPPMTRLYDLLAASAARKAQLLISDSHNTKKDAMNLLKVPPERIRVIYLACDHDRFHPDIPREKVDKALEKYGLKEEYILYLGGLDWRKNVGVLIRALTHLKGPRQLAIAGEPRSKDKTRFPDLRQVAHEAGVEARVRFLGWIEEEDKPALYAGARLFVFPSLYEGFGLPPLEAMACGTPVLCSNTSSLAEVVGQGGLMFHPRDEKKLAQLMAEVLTNKKLQEDLKRRGSQQARLFHWGKTAQETKGAYEYILGKH